MSIIAHISLWLYRCTVSETNLWQQFVVGNHLDAQFLLWYAYLNPLHVSSNSVLNLRRTVVLIQHRVIIPEVVSVQLSSLGGARSCSRHVEDSNKHIIEEIRVKLVTYHKLYEDTQSKKYKIFWQKLCKLRRWKRHCEISFESLL